MDVEKAQRVPFIFFGTMRLFKILIFRFFSKILKLFSKIFQCLQIFQFLLLHFFDILHHTGFSKSPKGPPFTNLKTFRLLSLGYSADFSRRSRLANMASFQRRQVMNHAVCSGILII